MFVRRRLALFALPTLVLGGAEPSLAADWFEPLWAQSASMSRGPGFYLNPFKFVPIPIFYLLWVWTTSWVDDDLRDLEDVRFATWNSVVFFTGLAGLVMVLAIPVYPVGLLLLILSWSVPLFVYIYSRNQKVSEQEKVMTPYHFGEIANGMMRTVGLKPLFNKDETGQVPTGPAIEFIGKTSGNVGADPDRVNRASGSPYILSAKELVYDAILRRSTDIHLEPTVDQLSVRYRIDGILHAAEPFDRQTGDAVINIFKVLGAMDISEKRKPQDGSFGAKLEQREVEFRVATSGSKAGEKLVMRILDNSQQLSRLEDLGMRPKLVESVREIVNQPHGMFLCCGPTGSGKSTTLYSCMREIDRFQKNIITVEDPIEYQIDNVTQMEINTKSGQTFATSLRSILRQDPDVIMIGEIRDQETADIACQAATTGHLVFSTVHANDSTTALFRLIDLGVEPFKIASALSSILAQRLVRVLCEACKEPYKPDPKFLRKANIPADKVDVFYRPPEAPEEICPQCGGTGYLGRSGIYELLTINSGIRDLLRDQPSINAIKTEARKAGMVYLQEDGLRQVIMGRTSIKELLRVVK